jgi:hypothetical protein
VDDYGGTGFGVAAGAVATMGQRAAARHAAWLKDPDDTQRNFEILHQIPIGAIQVPITASNGVFQMNDLLMPKAGYMWSIRNLAASGYTAGSVVAYKGGMVVGGAYTGGGHPFPFSAAGTATIGRAELTLDQGDALIIVCTGITLVAGFAGVQINGTADCFERWYLPHYLGMRH